MEEQEYEEREYLLHISGSPGEDEEDKEEIDTTMCRKCLGIGCRICYMTE